MQGLSLTINEMAVQNFEDFGFLDDFNDNVDQLALYEIYIQ